MRELNNRSNKIQDSYGFTAHPNFTKTKNFNNAINSISKHCHSNNQLHLLQPKNLSVHNLCKDNPPPLGTKNLLGLGLKFCLATPKANPNIKQCLRQMAYKIRTKHYLTQNNTNNKNNIDNASSYIPQIYVKLQGWNPPPTSITVENRLTDFEKLLETAIQNNKRRKSNATNLTQSQQKTLNTLKHNFDFIIMPTDKNLGPAIMNRDDYIEQCLTEHLLTPHYKQLCKTTAMEKLNSIKTFLINTLHTHKHQLTPTEVTYFSRSLKLPHRIPIFYGMPKVHKTPMALRPVVSCIKSFLSIFSNWLDFKMKELLFLFPSYIKDSKNLLQELKELKIPPNSKLFTADATAMYSNIDTNTGIQAFKELFDTYESLIPHDFPKELFLIVLKIVMDNNIFKFGDTFWQQIQGTAMGTPAAPLYSIITYGVHENTTILNTFKPNLIYYKRFIDDIFGIWTENNNTINSTNIPDTSWNTFKQQINKFGSLKWNIESLTESTTFLDLSINITGNKLITTTYQKPLNLYLYIPPLSAHPSSCLKGLITGEIYRYWSQNSNTEDFINITTNFILRLTQRGHQIDKLIPMLQTAASNIDNINTRKEKQKDTDDDDTLYIHWRHHPSNIHNHTIRQIYNKTLKGFDGFKDMRLAISRPKNLRDILCNTDLPTIPNHEVSHILSKVSTNLDTSP